MNLRYRFCWIVITCLIFSLLISSPAHPASLDKMYFLAQAASDQGGSVAFSQANKDAEAKLAKMTPEEMEALDNILAEALTLYYDGKFAQALPMFHEIAGKAETMDVIWWLGTSAMKSGKIQLAIEEFKKMLAVDPHLHRVRLELAAAYFELRRYDDARRELTIVKASNPPEEVKKKIDMLLAAIEDSLKKVFWNIRFSEGLQWDSNISTGPDNKDIPVSGGTLTLGDESKKIGDWASITNFAANVLYDIGERQGFMWNTALEFYNSAYLNHGKFNYMMTDINTGPWWVGRQDVVKIPVGYTLQDYGSMRLSNIFHINPSYEHYFNQFISMKGAFAYSREVFADAGNNGLDNSTRHYEIGPNFYLANRRHIISLVAGIENSDTNNRSLTYDSQFYSISYFTKFPTNTEFFLRYQWQQKDYKEKPTLFDDYRVDRRNSITALISQGFYKNYFTSFAFNYLDNHSSAELYKFEKETYTLSVGCYF